MTTEHASAAQVSLSLSQREVWLDQRAWPGSKHLTIGGAAFLEGNLDPAVLRRSLTLLVEQCDAFRLVPALDGMQEIRTEPVVFLELLELTPDVDTHQQVQNWWATSMQSATPWDGTPPWRFALLRGSGLQNVVIMQYHHLMMDGWGTSQVIQRWSRLYNELLSCRSIDVPATANYAQYIEETAEYRQSAAFAKDAAFWAEQMPVLQPALIERKFSHQSPTALPDARMVHESIPVADYNRLIQVAGERSSSAFNYFLAAMVIYFARTTGRTTVVVGVPSLNRGGRRYRETLGMFVGVLPVSVTLEPGMTVDQLLSTISLTMRGALRHARFPLSEVGRPLEVMRHGRDGLFDLLLSFERQDYNVSFGEARMAESRQLFCGKARYPLSVTICEFQPDQDLDMVLEGSSACFSEGDIAHIGQRLWHLVQRMTLDADVRVDSLPLLTEQQHSSLVHGFHRSVIFHEETVPFIVQFERCAKETPQSTALVWDEGTLTFGQLNDHCNRMALRLTALGAARDRVVAVSMGRSADLVIAILAIAKSGAAFLPLDPDAPLARLSAILDESGALALLIQEQGLERFAQLNVPTVLTNWNDTTDAALWERAAPVVSPADLAYVLFTSGSTGRPKGVMVEQANLSRRLAWLSRNYGVTAADRSGLGTQITFDPSLIELCLPLIHGGSVALPPPGRLLPEALADFAMRHAVTIMAFVPSTLSRFLDRAGNQPDLKLRVACCGGEVLSAELSNRYLRETRARLFNVYGPTETCIFATAWECVPSPDDFVLPIGIPVDDTRIYVLDGQLQPLPAGVAGEVFIGGGAVARGYMNRPELDHEVFLSDPFHAGQRMYRTGDRGWLGEDGTLHFVGRLDRQIKLRGYRIELGEIESALMAVEGVTQAAVKLTQRGDKQILYAWVATTGNHASDTLQRTLRVRLPDYMIPAGISVMESLPLNSTGKIDYAALQEAAISIHAAPGRSPNNNLERDLLSLWERELGKTDLSVTDNFFDAGGDSLAAVSILAGIEKLTGAKIPLYLLTEHPTVERLAQVLGADQPTPGVVVNFNVASKRMPLYVAASGHGDLLRFQNLARATESFCDVRMLQPPLGQQFEGVASLATLYADAIEIQQGLPCYVAGFSVGGITALETANALQKRGLPVQGLILLDTIYPRAIWGGTLFWRLFVWAVKGLHVQDLSLNGRRLGAMVNDAGLVDQVMSMAGHRPRRFDGPSLLVKTSGLARWSWLLFGPWRKFLGAGYTESQIPGLHGSMFEAARIDALVSVLRDATQSRQP